VFSSFHHVNPSDILEFPVDFEKMQPSLRQSLLTAVNALMCDMKARSEVRQRIHKGGKTSRAQTFFPSESKFLVDSLDHILARHYRLTAEELDYVINYDIKYRLLAHDEED